MNKARFLDKTKVVEKGVNALHRALGPVEARRFLAMASRKHEDSVVRHRKWQQGLDEQQFVRDMKSAYGE
jgi:hypothetical protein